jgi:hypothetical protein
MSALSKGTVKITSPVGHTVSNYGPDVQTIVFSHNGVHDTISRVGKHNLVTFESFVHSTVTLSNGRKSETFRRLPLADFRILAVISTAGVVYVQGRDW